MAHIEFPQEKKQQVLIIVFIAITVVISLVIYFGFLRSSATLPADELLPMGSGNFIETDGETVKTNEEIGDINFLFLQDSRFLELKKYGEWPIQPRQSGRENPFQPFEGYVADKKEAADEAQTGEELVPEEESEESEQGEVKSEQLEEEPEEDLEKSVEEATIEELLRLLGGDTGTTTGQGL